MTPEQDSIIRDWLAEPGRFRLPDEPRWVSGEHIEETAERFSRHCRERAIRLLESLGLTRNEEGRFNDDEVYEVIRAINRIAREDD